MSVGILLITHGNIGGDLADTARNVLGADPLAIAQLSVTPSDNPDQVLEKAKTLCRQLDEGDGVLVITDMFGSTPSNIACRLNQLPGVRILAGLNLPMLIRVLNYPTLSLDALCAKALSGGHDGVLDCQQSAASRS
ncbi:PTS sugar transporter subunit IIA [Acidihalobacter ferrooxydans]|uniref:PTS fructose transporter subunit IIA n=1 Tax=Acidihalobacter ferrooxydans TaxID=1765967 RepID=A0A1P8UJG0_9GAMM|nr:PTS sugar transporter subunit IIA [Acidihalobacter ferrooxydans]APZ43940.1 PTS fructose transporter subunit IIA [Acidihalobacter ferrooxydans]